MADAAVSEEKQPAQATSPRLRHNANEALVGLAERADRHVNDRAVGLFQLRLAFFQAEVLGLDLMLPAPVAPDTQLAAFLAFDSRVFAVGGCLRSRGFLLYRHPIRAAGGFLGRFFQRREGLIVSAGKLDAEQIPAGAQIDRFAF